MPEGGLGVSNPKAGLAAPLLIRAAASSSAPHSSVLGYTLCWDRMARQLQTSHLRHGQSRSTIKAPCRCLPVCPWQYSVTHPSPVIPPGLTWFLSWEGPYYRPPTWVQRNRTGKCTGKEWKVRAGRQTGQCLVTIEGLYFSLSERLGLSISLVFGVEIGNSKPIFFNSAFKKNICLKWKHFT